MIVARINGIIVETYVLEINDASFKYGDFEGVRNGRFFLDLTEKRLQELIDIEKQFKIIEFQITTDARPDRTDEQWLNVILQKC